MPPTHDRASPRLLRDLAVVGLMQQDRPDAAARIESLLGVEFADVLRTSLAEGSGDVHGVSPRCAA